MATKSLDTFTGSADVDIAGRTPDGGGTSATEGVWHKVDDSPGTGTFDIVGSSPLLGIGAGVRGSNVASLSNVPLIPSRDVGDRLGVLVYSRDSVARTAVTPSGYDEIARSPSAGGGELSLFTRDCDGTEADTLTVTFSGAGLAGCDQLAFCFAMRGVTGVPTVGSDSSWLSADNLGPISGITPGTADSLILACGGKQNDFNGLASAAGFTLGAVFDSTIGTDAGMALLWQVQSGGPTGTGDVTIADTGGAASNGAGTGFLVAFPLDTDAVEQSLRHAGAGVTNDDWNHYVVKDISTIGGGFDDMMVEATFRFYNANAVFGAVLARHLDPNETGYELNYQPGLPGTFQPVLTLYHIWEGVYTDLRIVTLPMETAEEYRELKVLRLCISGPSFAADIKAYINDVRYIPDDGTLDPLGNFIHTPTVGEEIDGGWPGLCMHDITEGGAGTALACTRWRAAEFCDDTEVPCTGPPDNPYPTDPPPVPTPPTAGEFPMQVGRWRHPLVPSWANRAGAFRQTGATLETIRKWVMAHGQWRLLSGDAGETDPPPDTEFPPYYDPCELHPPLPVPPGEPLDAPPARLFFAYDLPITTLGQLFTATPNSTGPWSPGNLAQAAARSGYIIGSQGTYTLYQSGGQYQRSLMQARIDSHASYYPALMASPWWYGQQVMDDHAARERWNWPSGWSDTDIINEISWIAGYWKTQYPGIRVLIRARAAQFSGSNYPANVDGIIAQYRYWGLNRTPAQFVAEELNLCAARGWTVLFSINIENGGLGASGHTHRVMYEMTAGEVNTAWEAMTVDTPVMHGIGMWRYSAEILTRPGMLDVIAVRRNALAALGPP